MAEIRTNFLENRERGFCLISQDSSVLHIAGDVMKYLLYVSKSIQLSVLRIFLVLTRD